MKALMKTEGLPYPLGAEYRDGGVNFAIFSQHAEAITLCLYDNLGQVEQQQFALIKGENYIWHIFVEGISPGAKYGYRVDGRFSPEEGFRFNPNKVLIDPYSREIDRAFSWQKSLFSYDLMNNEKDLRINTNDSITVAPKSVVTKRMSAAEIEKIQVRKPRIPWRDTIIYETHVRGFSQLNLDIPSKLRGTIGGLAHPKSIEYFKQLGITAIELLPVHSFVDEEFLVKHGLSNYWGYNTLNFFCPHRSYLQNGKNQDFLDAVETLHAAGLEVILDVVYNHTAEASELGPTLCFRGIDNHNYYRLDARNPRFYINDTGCGNTLRVDHPRVMQLILDSLRFWAGEMGVDGFRFDLASILGRDSNGFDQKAAFFQAISQDPLLSQCKLIAEPWDIGPGGYQLGAYPGEWSEWNDQYRDICRRFWRGEGEVMPEFARRIHGSSDIFEASGRSPRASINFIASHDGFTLADLVSYKEKHNLDNQENNRDGHHANFSENYGVEGETDKKDILDLRQRQQRNLLTTLIFSQGTPMLLAGDELGRTQEGNNNAYCQDNEINWLDWDNLRKKNMAMVEFTQYLITLRKQYSLFSSPVYIHRPEDMDKEHRAARWISCHGKPMSEHDWHDEEKNILGWILQSRENGDSTVLLLIFNAHPELRSFQLPKETGVNYWRLLLDTTTETGRPNINRLDAEVKVNVDARSILFLQANG